MRYVWSREVAELLPSQIEKLPIFERERCPVSEIVDLHHAPQGAEGDLGIGGGLEPLVHGSALVGFDMSEAEPAQLIEWQDALNGVLHQWK